MNLGKSWRRRGKQFHRLGQRGHFLHKNQCEDTKQSACTRDAVLAGKNLELAESGRERSKERRLKNPKCKRRRIWASNVGAKMTKCCLSCMCLTGQNPENMGSPRKWRSLHAFPAGRPSCASCWGRSSAPSISPTCSTEPGRPAAGVHPVSLHPLQQPESRHGHLVVLIPELKHMCKTRNV